MLHAANPHFTSQGKIVIWLLLFVISCLCVFLGIKYTILKLEVAFARGQVTTFEVMRASSQTETNANKIAEALEYVINYYPSGSKQRQRSSLDSIVETARSNAVTAIISRLRMTTGKDFGTDPNAWLKEYLSGR